MKHLLTLCLKVNCYDSFSTVNRVCSRTMQYTARQNKSNLAHTRNFSKRINRIWTHDVPTSHGRFINSHFSSVRSSFVLGGIQNQVQVRHNSSNSTSSMTETTASSTPPPSTEVKAKARTPVHKDLRPLTTRRIVRRKKSKDSAGKDEAVYNVTAYATAGEYNLETLRSDILKQGLYGIVRLPSDAEDALHAEARYRISEEPREIFFFREGTVVFWNMPEEERTGVLNLLKRHQQDDVYDATVTHEEYEEVDYTYTESKTELVGAEIQLQKAIGSPLTTNQLEKYAFSNGISQSVQLNIWEAYLDRHAESFEWVLVSLKEGRKINMSEAEILKKSGELMTLRHVVNLSSDLLDTPDFYYERKQLKQLYEKTCDLFHIKRRTKLMNDKLTCCTELSEFVRDLTKDKHHTRLEVMIIILILIEVLFEIMKIFNEARAHRKEKKLRESLESSAISEQST